MTFKLDRWRETVLIALLAAIAITRILACYPVFCQTYDEPMHLASGLEYLQEGIYSLTVQNPPLARILIAAGPLWDGAKFRRVGSPFDDGNAVLYSGNYVRRLSLARTGNLPLLLAAIVAIALWGRRATRSAAGGVLAVLLFTTIPAILGHSAVATVDLGAVTGFALLIVAAIDWLEEPAARRAALAGAALGVGTLLKFTTPLFSLPVITVLALLRLRDRGAIAIRVVFRDAAIAVLVAASLIWAAYGFTVVPAQRLPELLPPGSPLLPLFTFLSHLGIPMPAGEFVAGLAKVEAMNRLSTYPAYFMGKVSIHGHTWFYPTVFAIKTPLPLLAFLLCALALAVLRWRSASWVELSGTVAVVTILLLSLLIRLDAGIRYILPIYAAAAVAAANVATAIWQWKPHGRVIVTALVVIQAGTSFAIHPDYLADFNLLAGRHPERIVIDSDLDWGQDLFRLADVAHEEGIRELSVAYFGTAKPQLHDLAPVVHFLPPGRRVTGWIAISEVLRAPIWTNGYQWLAAYRPVRKAGKSIELYYIPEKQ